MSNGEVRANGNEQTRINERNARTRRQRPRTGKVLSAAQLRNMRSIEPNPVLNREAASTVPTGVTAQFSVLPREPVVFIEGLYSWRHYFGSSGVRLAVFAAFVCMSLSAEAQTQTLSARLEMLLQKKQYPELEQALATTGSDLSSETLAYFEGVMANRVNAIGKSIGLLEPLIPTLFVSNPVWAEVALCTVADDYAKSFRYKTAARIYAEAQRVATQQSTQSSCQAGLEASRWALLEDAPAQTVQTNGAFTIPGKRDSIGLWQVPIAAGNYSGFWIVDTGANLSVISQSVAARLGLEISSAAGTADGSSGASLPVHTAVIPEIRLGPAVVRNVPVLVAQDSDLTFPSIDYRIEGSLGLPVLAAFGTITVYRDGRVKVGSASDASQDNQGPHNLFFQKLAPLITADFGHGPQLFTIDTGAVGTILSAKFYNENKDSFDPRELVNLELLGAGGRLLTPAYQLRDVAATIAGRCAELKSVQVLTEPTGLADEFYGNIGQSALSSFTSFSLDFKNMHFSLNGGRPCQLYRDK